MRTFRLPEPFSVQRTRLPAAKSVDTFDCAAIPSLNKILALELARCEYILRRDNIIALGNSRTGKTHIGLSLGLAACQKGVSIAFTVQEKQRFMIVFGSIKSVFDLLTELAVALKRRRARWT